MILLASKLKPIVDRLLQPKITSSSWLAFALIVCQFGLILLVFERFELENAAVRNILRLSYAGFIIHHFLPLRLRQSFFLLLSLVGVAWVLGMSASGWDVSVGLGRTAIILAIGSTLIGICHLPIPYAARTTLLLGSGIFLALLRTGTWLDFGSYAAIWPILGTIFMFRLIVYQYDLENMKEKPTLVRSLSYFFMLPNVCFPLFPVIDFKTFCRNYFREDTAVIYDTGLRWMLRGITHLLLWRLVYYHFFLDPSKVTDGQDLVQFLVSNMLLYLRVSGEFHFVIGLLHMFGFNLPETNRFYFLSSSFTDYWRRVNIYWKDFILKIIYNPIVFRLKKLGESASVIIATVIAFGLTWLLHSYQWFWLRGDFPVAETDVVFWGALGVLVIANSLHELKQGRRRTLSKRSLTGQEEFLLGFKTAATFATLTVLWSVWNSQSMNHFIEMWKLADLNTLWISALVLTGIGLARVVLERSEYRTSITKPKQSKIKKKNHVTYYDLRRAVFAVVLPGLLIGVLSIKSLYPYLGSGVNIVLTSLSSNSPNQSDEEQMQAGYYEDLMDVRRFDALLSESFMSRPADWQILENTSAIQKVDSILLKELTKSSEQIVNGNLIKINSHGMRDKEYPLSKSDGSYRIALLGSSLVMGWGVDQGKTFEAILEQRLNGENHNVQIMNFAVNGYTPLSQVAIMESHVMPLKPDAIYLIGHHEDINFTKGHLAKAIRMKLPIEPYLLDIANKAKVDANTPQVWAAHRLDPYWPTIITQSLQRIGSIANAAGVDLVWIYLPGVFETANKFDEEKQLQMRFAREAGFRIIDLSGLYNGQALDELAVAPWDAHPNAKAHNIIAEMLYSEMEESGEIGQFNKP